MTAHGNAVRAEKHDTGMIALSTGTGVQISGEGRPIRQQAPISAISEQAQCLLDLTITRHLDRRSV
ncbi:hypothetical protein C3Y91_03555 [Rhizobium sp. UPM1133]|nr:hypothetical protein [Rhizobium ruizarguesonis]